MKLIEQAQKTIEKIVPRSQEDSDIRAIAEEYLKLKKISDLIEARMAALKPTLVDARAVEFFPEFDAKVQYAPGARKTEIDPIGVWNDMVAAGQQDDFAKVVSVTATALSKIANGKGFAERNTSIIGSNADSVKVANLSKDDLILVQSNFLSATPR
jgi:hypothetical protein